MDPITEERFNEIFEMRDASLALRDHFERSLAIYANEHPALQGIVSESSAFLTSLTSAASAACVLLPAIESLANDDSLTLLDHAALHNLLDILLENGSAFSHAIDIAITCLSETHSSHDPSQI